MPQLLRQEEWESKEENECECESDDECEQQSEQENVQSPTLGGITWGLCQLPASVPLGSKLQHLQRDGHVDRRNDNICSISVFCHTLVEAECKLSLQQRQVL